MNPKLTVDHLRRRALVYIRQSTPDQVLHHQESTRRQYGLVDQARAFGFREVVVIDEGLGRTGSGLVERPGFQRLVAEVCAARSARCSVLRPRGWCATVATGTISSSCVAW
jgi:DNA invertase Pin-like site-specific DNA recombinase